MMQVADDMQQTRARVQRNWTTFHRQQNESDQSLVSPDLAFVSNSEIQSSQIEVHQWSMSSDVFQGTRDLTGFSRVGGPTIIAAFHCSCCDEAPEYSFSVNKQGPHRHRSCLCPRKSLETFPCSNWQPHAHLTLLPHRHPASTILPNSFCETNPSHR